MNIFYIIQFFIYIVSALLLWRDETRYGSVLFMELSFLIVYIISVFRKNEERYISIKEGAKLILINILSIAIINFLINANIIIDYNNGLFAGLGAFVCIFIVYPIANGVTLMIFLASNLGKYINKKIKAKKEIEKDIWNFFSW